MRFVLGVDEAGRGPLAGPVAVGVVAVPEAMLPKLRRMFPGVNDSKQLSEGDRERIYARMNDLRGRSSDFRFCVRFAGAGAIDERGIVPAVYGCAARGIRALAPEPAGVRILLDGALRAPHIYEQRTIVGGDASEAVISLASIAAKVERDRRMKRLAKRHPVYGFEKHKGYGTARHYAMLEKHGPCVIHRRSFLHLELTGDGV
jgi:ribonuclease HII